MKPNRRHLEIAATRQRDWNTQSDLFTYDRQRFLCNEKSELACRRASFDMKSLAEVAAKASGAERCVNIVKCPEAMNNKVFIMTMDNGTQVVAKVANIGTGRPHFTTASEVATMEFVRDKLSTPVPKVLSWSSRADQTPVGAEYIIMERVAGIPLARAWTNMSFRQKAATLTSLFAVQKAWMSVTFTRYGSLYFADDVDVDKQGSVPLYIDRDSKDVTETKYVVGPTNRDDSFEDGRTGVQFDRGPWPSAKDYLVAVGHREVQCIKTLDKLPITLIALGGPKLYTPARQRKLQAIDAYLKMIDFLLPSDQRLSAATLWHHDFHAENIFVDEKDTSKITGIIDRQFVEIAPLFQCAQQPDVLQYVGEQLDDVFKRPDLPDNYDELTPDEQRRVGDLWEAQPLVVYYRTLTMKKSKRLHECFEYRSTDWRAILSFARSVLEIGEDFMLSKIAAVVTDKEMWSQVPGGAQEASTSGRSDPPLTFSHDAMMQIAQRLEALLEGVEEMKKITARLGVTFMRKSAPVDPDRYTELISLLEEIKGELSEKYAESEEDRLSFEKLWPSDGN